ncbi:hypothetical protein HO173_001441 [Letharia columbiana]|uniref:Uncharacterized protein n=1 Tax=Letharia columbiana TaxID=112416 RepID=A0A8H6G568_9LECA|nr:uncharacterized protein HO173_001441 [Letharia columbiana]KAF6240768.1 hypothetical protein HO173_001441 [Letharia columbiana]
MAKLLFPSSDDQLDDQSTASRYQCKSPTNGQVITAPSASSEYLALYNAVGSRY